MHIFSKIVHQKGLFEKIKKNSIFWCCLGILDIYGRAFLSFCIFEFTIDFPIVQKFLESTQPRSQALSPFSSERPWLRLVTCLLDFSRFQRNDWREGRESKSLSRLSPSTEPSREWNCNLKLNVAWSAGKTFLFLEKMSTRNLQPTPKMISKSSVPIDLFTAGCVENLGTDPGRTTCCTRGSAIASLSFNSRGKTWNTSDFPYPVGSTATTSFPVKILCL